MTEPSRIEDSENAQALVTAALRDMLRAGMRDAAPLRTTVTDYVRARRSVGLRPEEVVIELKAEIAKTVKHTSRRVLSGPDFADVVSEQVVRLAIEAYFAD